MCAAKRPVPFTWKLLPQKIIKDINNTNFCTLMVQIYFFREGERNGGLHRSAINFRAMQYSAVQFRAVQFSTEMYRAVQCRAVQ